jgi:hypothetical protein
MPTPPSIFVSGILNSAPSTFAAAAEAISITEPLRKVCFFIVRIVLLYKFALFTKIYVAESGNMWYNID